MDKNNNTYALPPAFGPVTSTIALPDGEVIPVYGSVNWAQDEPIDPQEAEEKIEGKE
jgi:hypothetical protein